jgi:glucosylglycerate phosphorylase
MDLPASIPDLLTSLYGEGRAADTASRLERVLQEAGRSLLAPTTARPLSQKDAVLIVYPDQLTAPGRPPLAVLKDFLDRQVGDVITTVHLLPFFPSSSDDGFAVMDYLEVDSRYGSWDDIRSFGEGYRLMVDAVLNHASARGLWFEAFLRGEEPWRRYFLAPDTHADWSRVVRPRTSPLFTTFETSTGPSPVWTTFSPDQVDLNYADPDLLLAVIGILLEYLRRGAQWIRLDAAGFLCKEPGTTCLHLPQTHAIVRLLRAVIERVAPWARLITETNVPHVDNVAYLGGGHEAHMIYQFTLAPLVVHALLTGDARPLTAWASSLSAPPPGTCYLNFLASHDGLGLLPAVGWLSEVDIERLVAKAQDCGGVSYRAVRGGLGPYELNANLFDFLGGPYAPEQGAQDDVRRFIIAHAILLAMAGIPAIYFHSLVGSRGDPESVRRTGLLRSINRQRLAARDLEAELASAGRRRQVLNGLRALLQARAALSALHPAAPQEILDLGPHVFGLRRRSSDGSELICLAELASQPAHLSIGSGDAAATDVLLDEAVRLDAIRMAPLQARWIVVPES